MSLSDEIKSPFTIDEIKNSPLAVFCAILIILIFILLSRIYYLDQKKDLDHAETEKTINVLYNQMLQERDNRLIFYEQMIFYKTKSERYEYKDSVFKERSQPFVEKILK